MKKMILGVGVGAVVVLSIIAIMGFALAQNNEYVPVASELDANTVESNVAASGVSTCANGGSCGCGKKATGFVDVNNDGVCDNAGSCAKRGSESSCDGRCGARQASKSGCGCHKAAIAQ